ncbi:hypothetical protein ASG90_17580 [Nocardioides sp. Soil797]|nr:hypothetical protein ASG90_17580 [Nocardioides sp. Soil797]
MARTADHEARKAQIIRGVTSLALSEGLGRVTVAGAARSAGVSVGLVQHYYASKEELFLETFDAVRDTVLARVDAATARAEQRGARIEHMLADGLKQMLPLDRRRREEAYLVHAFTGLCLDDEKLLGHLRTSDAHLSQRVATALENGKVCGEVDSATDSAAAGFALLALTGGMATRLLTSPGTSARRWATEALAARAAELCPGTCTHNRRDA